MNLMKLIDSGMDFRQAKALVDSELDSAYSTAQVARNFKDDEPLERGYKWARALHAEYDRQLAQVFGTYDTIYMGPSEWGSDTMRAIAADHFKENPDAQYVLIHEHAGWFLGFRRDGSCFTTANDMAVMDRPYPKPYTSSGTYIRRESLAA